jgi:hypothetical protein
LAAFANAGSFRRGAEGEVEGEEVEEVEGGVNVERFAKGFSHLLCC